MTLRRNKRGWVTAVVLAALVGTVFSFAVGHGPARADLDGYGQAVYNDSPLAFYRMGDASGTDMTDSAPSPNDGTYASGVTLQQPGPAADGDDYGVESANPSSGFGTGGSASVMPTGDDPWTMEVWYKDDPTLDPAGSPSSMALMDFGTPGNRTIVGMSLDRASDVQQWGVNTSSDSNLCIDLFGELHGWDTTAVGVNLRDGQWHYLVLAYSGSGAFTGYVDGIDLGTLDEGGALDIAASILRLGYWTDTVVNQPAIGTMSEAAVYGTALSQSQVSAHLTAADAPATTTTTTTSTTSTTSSTTSTTSTTTSPAPPAPVTVAMPVFSPPSSGASPPSTLAPSTPTTVATSPPTTEASPPTTVATSPPTTAPASPPTTAPASPPTTAPASPPTTAATAGDSTAPGDQVGPNDSGDSAGSDVTPFSSGGASATPADTTGTDAGSDDGSGATTSSTTTSTTTGSDGSAAAAQTSEATLPPAPKGDVQLSIQGQAGVTLANSMVTVTAKGFEPGSEVVVSVHSVPIVLATGRADQNGDFEDTVAMPQSLPPGNHHVVVDAVTGSGQGVEQSLAFTVARGSVLGTVGATQPAPLADDVAFQAAAHPHKALGTTTAAAAAAAAVSAGVAGGTRSGGTGQGSSASGGYLEDVELEREDHGVDGQGRGDRSRTWRWPGTARLDRYSTDIPHQAARWSPVLARVLTDGDYLRAMLGSLWAVLCGVAVGLGVYAASTSGWYAVPPPLPVFLAVLGLGVLDSTLGYLAGASFLGTALLSGHVTTAPEVRLAAGVVLVWFAIPLAAAALRPLRRRVRLHAGVMWDRAADVVIGGLFAAWVAQKMVGALSGLAGVVLPIDSKANVVALAVLGFVGLRVVVETVCAHHYPDRLARVLHRGDLEAENLQVGLSILVQIALFIFISVPYVGWSWALWVGIIVFWSPIVPWLFIDRVPKSAFITKWRPQRLLSWTLIIGLSALISQLLDHTIHDDTLLLRVGFFATSLPIVAAWALELFEIEEEEADEEEQEEDQDGGLATSEVVTEAETVVANAARNAPARDHDRTPALALTGAREPHPIGPSPQVVGASPDSVASHSVEEPFTTTHSVQEPSTTAHSEDGSTDHHHAPTLRLWLLRIGGVPAVALCVYLVTAHLAGG